MPELHILIFQFVVSILSSTVIPAQGELVLLAFLATGKYTAWLLVSASCAGALLGTAGNWVLGRYVSQFETKKWFPVKAAYMEKARLLFNRHGRLTLLLAGVPFIGDPITIVAGALKVDFWFYLVTAGLSRCARYGIIWLIYCGILQ